MKEVGLDHSLEEGLDDFIGLPCPPLDEEAFVVDQNFDVDISRFFDEINENGDDVVQVKQKPRQQYGKGKEMRKLLKLKPKPRQYGKGKELKIMLEVLKPTTDELKEVVKPVEDSKSLCEASLEAKIESTKRKMHEAYERVEKEKRQRKIQVIDFHNLPKQVNCRRKYNPRAKFGRPFVICGH